MKGKIKMKIKGVLIAFLLSALFLAFGNKDNTDFGTDPAPLSVTGELVSIIDDTCSNSMVKTGILHFDNKRIVDSVQFVLYAKGELDVDRFIGTKAFTIQLTQGYNITKNYTTLAGDTTTLTTNLDSNVSSVTHIVTWAGSKLQGANSVYCQVDAASSGNDATDPNLLGLYAIIFYRPE